MESQLNGSEQDFYLKMDVILSELKDEKAEEE
jgi:hypothetical protein